MKRKKLKKLIYVLASIVVLAALGFLFLFIFDTIHTIYNITANTEIIKCYSKQKPSSRINLFNATLYKLDTIDGWQLTEKLIDKSFQGSVELSDSTKIKMERVANGPLLVEIERPTRGVVATLRESGSGIEKITLVEDILFIEIHNIDSLLNSNTSIVIPFTGKVELGKSIEIESDNEYSLLLKSGDITMTGFTSFGGNYFVAGHEKLYLGDKLIFDDENSIGIATVNTESAIQVSYRAIGHEARIIKPGPKNQESGYRFSASIFSRFKYDKIFQSLSIIVGILIFLITVCDFYLNHFND